MKLMAYTNPYNEEETAEVDALWFDGYLIGERLLEGLPIKVTLTKDGSDIKIQADWPKGIAVRYWSQEAKEFALQHDYFYTTEDLDNDEGFNGFIEA